MKAGGEGRTLCCRASYNHYCDEDDDEDDLDGDSDGEETVLSCGLTFKITNIVLQISLHLFPDSSIWKIGSSSTRLSFLFSLQDDQ